MKNGKHLQENQNVPKEDSHRNSKRARFSWTNVGGICHDISKTTSFQHFHYEKNTFFVLKTKAFGSTCRPRGRSYGQTSPPLAPLPATGGVFVDSKRWKPSYLSWRSQKIAKNLWMFILAIFIVCHAYSCSLFYENVFDVSFWRLLCHFFCKAPSQLSLFFGKPCRPCCFPFRGDAWDGNEGGWISNFSSERFIR